MIKEKYIEDLAEIKQMMNQSSRFLSLSGMSGVLAGCYAIAAAYLATIKVPSILSWDHTLINQISHNEIKTLIIIALSTLFLAISTGSILTIRKAKKNNEAIWDVKSKQLLSSLAIPLIIGGVFSSTLIYNGLIGLISPVTLIFYGLSLVNVSRTTHEHIKYLGYAEITLGLIASISIDNGIIYWTIGFGVFHIIYGTYMHIKQK